jgi:putative phosphoesterase
VRVAALYDIHGNLTALDAVLAEVDADVILVGGDTVMGPFPSETLERLRSLSGDVRFIRGNADREVYDEKPGRAPHEAFEYARSRLSAEQLEFLRTLPLTLSIGPDERWADALAGVDADVVVCGHTHVQFDRRIGDTRLVNAGSVGMPYEHEPGAYWALLDGADVELRHTRCQAPNMAEWPGEWPQATPEEATEHFERMSRGEA